MSIKKWGVKPYNSLDYYFKSVYGRKIYKLALDGGMTCPNRDGVLDTRGCIFCSNGGSGEFAAPCFSEDIDVEGQLNAARERVAQKVSDGLYVAYFQSFTNTYAPIDYLRTIYTQALSQEDVVGMSIATRPDCLSQEVMALLGEMQEAFPDKFIWVELGLQTIHRRTAQYIRRGYELSVFEEAVRKLSGQQIPIIVHVILGLPGENEDDMLSTIEYINTFPIFGIKLQLLHVLKGTDLYTDYQNRTFEVLTREEYIDLVIKCLERLNPEIVIHRLTGDGPRSILVAPLWSTDKKNVLNTLLKEMETRQTWQGQKYENTGYFNVI